MTLPQHPGRLPADLPFDDRQEFQTHGTTSQQSPSDAQGLLLSQAGKGFSSAWCSKSQTGSRLHIQHGDAQIKREWFHVVCLEEDSWEETASFNVNTQSGYATGRGIAAWG